MHLIQVFLPLYDRDGKENPPEIFQHVNERLTVKFGGITTYAHAPAIGFWKARAKKPVKDELIIVEVMADQIEQPFWTEFRRWLESELDQTELVIRAFKIDRL